MIPSDQSQDIGEYRLMVTLVTLFPDMLSGPLAEGVLGQAIQSGVIGINFENPRDVTQDRHRSVDDRPFGGGDGMVMLAEPLMEVLQPLHERGARLVYLSPQGKIFDSRMAREFAQTSDLVLISGRYGGIDQRVLNALPIEEVSIGDYVLSGGEPAMWVVLDALSRFVPGVLGSDESAQFDSFENGLLDAPQFTRPRDFQGQKVPEVLLSGDHKKIKNFRLLVSKLITIQKRPDLYQGYLENLETKAALKDRMELVGFLKSLSEEDRLALGLSLKEEDVLK